MYRKHLFQPVNEGKTLDTLMMVKDLGVVMGTAKYHSLKSKLMKLGHKTGIKKYDSYTSPTNIRLIEWMRKTGRA